MKNIVNKADATPGTTGQLPAAEYNDHKEELQGSVEKSGQTLNASTPTQLSQALFINGVSASRMQDTGSGNTILLSPITGLSGLVVPGSYSYMDGALFSFNKSVENTSTAVIANLGQSGTELGAKTVLREDESPVEIGELKGECVIRWNKGLDKWILLKNGSKDIIVNTIASLRLISGKNKKDNAVSLGYWSKGDVIDIPRYIWDESSLLDDDGGSVIRPTSIGTLEAGRWVWGYLPIVHAKWFGVIGRAVEDDTDSFLNAVAYAKEKDVTLDMSACRIYLETLSASIDISDVEINGNSKPCYDRDDTDYMESTDNFLIHLGYYQQDENTDIYGLTTIYSEATALISNQDFAVFTGRTFYVRGVQIYCNPQKPNSAGFRQSDKPLNDYGGWSGALHGNHKGTTVRFTGTHGIYLTGGLETESLSRIGVKNAKGTALVIDAIDPTYTKAPIEYLKFENCSFTYCNGGGVWFKGTTAKKIEFDDCNFSGAGRYMTYTSNVPPTTHLDMIYAIRITPRVGYNSLIVNNCYAELIQGLLYIDGGYVYNITVKNNLLYYVLPEYLRYAVTTTSTVIRGMDIKANTFNLQDSPLYINDLTSESSDIRIEGWRTGIRSDGGAFDGQPFSYGVDLIPYTSLYPALATEHLEKSGSLGTDVGSGPSTGTYQIIESISTPFTQVAAECQVYMITSSWWVNNADNGGAYLFTVMRLSSGNYRGVSLAMGSTQGFTSPPVISASGEITFGLAQYYLGKVTRIDANQSLSQHKY